MIYRGMTLTLTDRCNAFCAFCGPGCGPERKRAMPFSVARRLMDEAAALGFTRPSVTCGEAFLYHDQ